jgi:GPI mannosyltransferase 3
MTQGTVTFAIDVPRSDVMPLRVALVLAALALVPCVLAVWQLGRVQPDEVFQVLEPAYWRVHGYGMMSWEWSAGLRNWAVPGVLAGILWVCEKLGVSHPYAYRAAVEVPVYLLHLAMLAAVYRDARQRGGSDVAGVIAAAAVGLFGFVLLYAGRTLSESFSAPLIVIGVTMLDRPGARYVGARLAFIAGIVLGLAVVVRYGSIPFVVAIMLWMAGRRDLRGLAALAGGGAVAAVLLATLDWATWGKPLHSLLAYVHFNVYPGEGAKRLSVNPPWYYVKYFVAYLPLWAWVGLAMRARLAWRARAMPLAMWAAALYLLSVAITPHKEPRFLYPAVVLLVGAAAPAVAGWVARLRGASRAAGVVALLVLTSWNYALHSDLNGDEFHAIVRATRPADTRGLLILSPQATGDLRPDVLNDPRDDWGSAGYFFIGKDIPRRTAWEVDARRFAAAMGDPRINRVVAPPRYAARDLRAAGFREEQQVGSRTIWSRP